MKTNKNALVKAERSLRVARDMQPDAIMLETHEPPFPLHIIWFLIIGLLIAAVVWACLAKVDKIVTATGKIVTERPPIVMKVYERTTIEKVCVKTGEVVKKGQILFRFDQKSNAAELERINEQLASYRSHAARLNAERNGYDVPFKIPANPTQDDLLQLKAYEARKMYYNQRILAYDVNLTRYQKTLDQLRITMNKYQDRTKKLSRIEAMMADLENTRAVSLRDLLETQISLLETSISVDNQAVQIVECEQQIQSTRAEKTAFERDWFRQIVEELVEIERNISSLQQSAIKQEVLVQFTELRAPCDGVVHELAPFQDGSGVQEAEALITIIPLDSTLRAEIDIPAKDISWVKVGDECRIKFDTFPFQQCGTMSGKILFISRDAFTDNPKGAAGGTQNDAGGRMSSEAVMTTYRAQTDLSGSLHGRAKGVPISPGMTITAEIKVGKRSVISYLVNPFTKALDEAIREP